MISHFFTRPFPYNLKSDFIFQFTLHIKYVNIKQIALYGGINYG